MMFASIFTLLAWLCATATVQGSATRKSPYQLRVTALVADENNNTKMQCWQLDSVFQEVPVPEGAAITLLSDFVNGTYTVVPPHSFQGAHNAPYYQIVAFIAGEVHISLPYNNQTHVVHGGKNGLLIANDPHTTGHITGFPTDEQTVVLQVAFPDQSGKGAPKHRIRHEGPCKEKEQIIYK